MRADQSAGTTAAYRDATSLEDAEKGVAEAIVILFINAL